MKTRSKHAFPCKVMLCKIEDFGMGYNFAELEFAEKNYFLGVRKQAATSYIVDFVRSCNTGVP